MWAPTLHRKRHVPLIVCGDGNSPDNDQHQDCRSEELPTVIAEPPGGRAPSLEWFLRLIMRDFRKRWANEQGPDATIYGTRVIKHFLDWNVAGPGGKAPSRSIAFHPRVSRVGYWPRKERGLFTPNIECGDVSQRITGVLGT